MQVNSEKDMQVNSEKKMNKALIIVGVGSHTKVQLRWFGHM